MNRRRHGILSVLQWIQVSSLVSVLVACQTRLPERDYAVSVQTRGHAHNDYEHPRPLLDALELGFSSVEADIHLVDGHLLVAHDSDETDPAKTLSKLYLEPLCQRFRETQGRISISTAPFILLIDIKTEAESTYQALQRVLERYRPLLTRTVDGVTLPGAVTVILSGNRPIETVAGQPDRLVAIDGRLRDLGSHHPPSLMPLISDHWGTHFRWRGEGQISEAERQRLLALVQQVHGEDRILRFWGNPDHEAYWLLAKQTGIDLVNTDALAGLAGFLDQKGTPLDQR